MPALWQVHSSLWISGKDSVPCGAEVFIYADLQGFKKTQQNKQKLYSYFSAENKCG